MQRFHSYELPESLERAKHSHVFRLETSSKTKNEMLKYAIAKDVKLNLSFAAGL